MAGTIRTKEKCPKCGKPFQENQKGLCCRKCRTTPNRYHLYLYARGYGRVRIYSGPDGYPLDSWERGNRLLAVIRMEMDQGSFDIKKYLSVHLKPLQFSNYAQAWAARREQDCQRQEISRAYLKEIKAYIRNYFIPFFAHQDIRNIRERHLEDFLRELPEHLNGKTRFNIMGVLHKLFKDAFRREEITQVPRFPEVVKRPPQTRFLTPEEQKEILAHTELVYRDFYTFLMLTGLRTGEGRALRWEDVDFKNNILHIRGSFDLDVYKPYTKSGEDRYLPLGESVRQILKNQPRALGGWVFVNSRGRHLSNRRIRTLWKAAADKAGIKATLYEATRHSFASQAVSKGAPERMIGDFLGHKHASTTRRYAKMKADSLKTVLDAVGDHLKN